MSNKEKKITKKIEEELIEKEEELVSEEPKTITMTVGINGQPTLNIQCDKTMSVKDMATALATIDLLNFNNSLNKAEKDKEKALYDFIMFQTLRREIFIQNVAKIIGDDEKILTALSELS